MKFNDYNITSEKDSEYINKCFQTVYKQEIEDLSEIIEKMENQRKTMLSANSSHQYDNLIDKLTEDIEKLKNIVHSTIYNKSQPTTYNLSVPKTFRKASQMTDPKVITPIRSIEENEEHAEYMDSMNSVPNVPPTPTLPNGSNTPQRRRPMQSFSIANIFQKFAIRNKKSASELAQDNKMRYHTVITTHCSHENIIYHNQIDIIRLLLLYITLRPHCRYASIISTIANDQFEGYVEMSELSV
jgi:hypothetical protein